MNLSPLMRLANYLTISRILMVPLFMVFFNNSPNHYFFLALLVFVVASITDYLDGIIARKEGVTSFGKFMDPLADKLLVVAALICFTRFEEGLIPGWVVLVIIGREFVVTGLRVVFAAVHGNFVSATILGKYKASSQMIAIILGLFLLTLHKQGLRFGWLSKTQDPHGPIYFMMYIPLFLTLVSGLEFLFRNRSGLRKLMFIPYPFSDTDQRVSSGDLSPGQRGGTDDDIDN